MGMFRRVKSSVRPLQAGHLLPSAFKPHLGHTGLSSVDFPHFSQVLVCVMFPQLMHLRCAMSTEISEWFEAASVMLRLVPPASPIGNRQ